MECYTESFKAKFLGYVNEVLFENQSWNEEGFNYLYQALLMREKVGPYTSRYTQVACAAAIFKNDI